MKKYQKSDNKNICCILLKNLVLVGINGSDIQALVSKKKHGVNSWLTLDMLVCEHLLLILEPRRSGIVGSAMFV